MTLQEIEVFLAVARSGSLSGAAEGLYITQPAVSRHIRALEEELGCELLRRGRGQRRVELTEQGLEFLPAAEKLRLAFREAAEAPRADRRGPLHLSSVGSVSTYLLPGVFTTFYEGGGQLVFHNYHSWESYDHVARGQVELALVSDPMHHPQVETLPLYREPMLLLTGRGLELPQTVHPTQLDPAREVRLPWNPEYDLWHGLWFRGGARPRLVVDQMSLLEEVFSRGGVWEDCWAVAPSIPARSIAQKTGARLHTLTEGPPEEVIYFLQGPRRKEEAARLFLKCLREELEKWEEVRPVVPPSGGSAAVE